MTLLAVFLFGAVIGGVLALAIYLIPPKTVTVVDKQKKPPTLPASSVQSSQDEVTPADLAKLRGQVENLDQKYTEFQSKMLDALNSPNPLAAATKVIAETPTSSPTVDGNKLDMKAALADLSNALLQAKARGIQQKQEGQDREKQVALTCSPSFDYVIKTFQSYLSDAASGYGYTVASTYVGVPDLFPTNQGVALGNISVNGNPDWSNFQANVMYSDWVDLSVKGSAPELFANFHVNSPTLFNPDFLINVSDNGVILYQHKCGLNDDYKPFVNLALSRFIAAQASKYPLK
jgi:hypothetical protein